MKQLLPLVCLFCVDFNGSAAKTYSIGARSLADCPNGTPPSACAKKYLMFPFPRVGRSNHDDTATASSASFARSQRFIGIVTQPRIGRSDSSLVQLSDSQRIYDADDEQPNTARLDYQRRASAQQDYTRNLDNYLSTRRSMSPWAFFLITPNFHNAEHALDDIMPQQLERQLDNTNEQ